jgi:CRP-like cAMP-binding protein
MATTAGLEGVHALVRTSIRRRKRSSVEVWELLEAALNPALDRPRIAAGVEVAEFVRRSGERYTMIRSPDGLGYMRLSEEDREIFDLIDGSRTVKEIVVARFQGSGRFTLSMVTDLVEELRAGDFLDEPSVSVFEAVLTEQSRRDSRLPSWMREFALTRRIEWKGAHAFFQAMYRRGGRFFYAPVVVAVSLTLLVVGGLAFVVLLGRGKYTLIGESAAAGIATLYLVDLASTLVHESGHALSVVHYGRRVNAAGIMFYLGMPALYIDTTDIWMSHRRSRIVTTAAGPYIEWTLAGVASIVALLMPVGVLTTLMYRYAVLSYITIIQNLIPFLRLDGYYILLDLIDIQNLRERAFEFLRAELPGKLRRREKLSRQEKWFGAYGFFAGAFVALAIVFSVAFWGRVFSDAVRSAFRSGWFSRVLVIALMALVLAPALRALLRAGVETVKGLRFALRLVRQKTQQRWRGEAVGLVQSLPLGADLDDEALEELAGHVSLRRVRAGRPVVRQGERGDEFFVVRSGTLEVLRAGDDGEERLIRTLERGRSFGEVALLGFTPRMATVRARVTSEVFVIDKGTFDRVLAGRVEIAADIVAGMHTVSEIRTLAPFATLDEADAARVAREASWESYSPGSRIVKQADEGSMFYVVVAGQVEVILNRHVQSVLGPGAYFGETALLLDVPRTATVRALTPVRVLALDRPAFDKVLARSFRKGKLAPSRALSREWEH